MGYGCYQNSHSEGFAWPLDTRAGSATALFIVPASTGADAPLIVGLIFGKVQPLNYIRANRFRQA
jgi:hypothetical protein